MLDSSKPGKAVEAIEANSVWLEEVVDSLPIAEARSRTDLKFIKKADDKVYIGDDAALFCC